MKLMACRKRHSAEDIVRKLRRADELAAEGKTGEEIAADLAVSAATQDLDLAQEAHGNRHRDPPAVVVPPRTRADADFLLRGGSSRAAVRNSPFIPRSTSEASRSSRPFTVW